MTAPKKNECLRRVRDELAVCTQCGRPYDSVGANSHRVHPDDDQIRIYFQFLHGTDECIDHTYNTEFETWLAEKKGS